MRILICDDEGIVQQAIRFMIQKSFGDEFEIESAKNGRMAIELAESFRPDIILMDIQMTGINGIEAMEEIKREHKNIIFIVLTAYDKFEYSQKAIDIGVMSYLTKPINKDVLTDTLRKAMKLVNDRREKVSKDLKVKEKLEVVVPMIESGFVYSVLLGESNDTSNLTYRELLGINTEYVYAIVIECGEELRKGELTNTVGAGIRLQKHSMIFREMLKETMNGIVGSLMGNKVIVLVPCREKEESYNEREVKIENIRSMLRKMEQQMEMKFKAGIGSVVSWEEVSKSYREALDTARQGVGKVNHAKDLPVSCVYEEGYPYDMESGLFDAVHAGDAELTEKRSTEFVMWMEKQFPEVTNNVRLKVMEFVLLAEKSVYEQGAMTYHFDVRANYLDQLMSFQTYEGLERWFVHKMTEAAGHISMKQQEKTVNVVEKAKVYIAEHFSGEISLEETAKELGISSYYLSKLFKESENVNYIDYVNNLRIEYAKKQLMETEKSIKEICMESGYGDPNYFSRIFKKWTGVTPTEYREEGRYE